MELHWSLLLIQTLLLPFQRLPSESLRVHGAQAIMTLFLSPSAKAMDLVQGAFYVSHCSTRIHSVWLFNQRERERRSGESLSLCEHLTCNIQ